MTPEFFAAYAVSELERQSDYWLEEQGRLTDPMRYNGVTDHYEPISWDDAFALIGTHLRALESPDRADFYTSGRASNEAAFLYQIFVRRFGTNNFPDCSNMCHEATSVGLPESIGIGKGTVLLEDFDKTDAIFVIGQNPGTNSPRMMTPLREASRRGVPIVAMNPLRERALERFAAPQDPIEMVTFSSTRIASEYCQVRVGGDVAALKGVMKLVLEAHEAAVRSGGEPVLDLPFIEQHTTGFEALRADLLEHVLGMTSCAYRACRAPRSNAWLRSICKPSPSSSALGWELPSIATARRTCSKSPIFSCFAATSAGPARASVPSGAIPMCRATARSASTKSQARNCSARSRKSSASGRPSVMGGRWWIRFRR